MRSVLPFAGCGLAGVLVSCAAAVAAPIEIVSQSAKADFAGRTVAFQIQFNQAPDLTTTTANGHPANDFFYDIDTTPDGEPEFTDFDVVGKRNGTELDITFFDFTGGEFVNPRGPV